jgi:hypothetical protein
MVFPFVFLHNGDMRSGLVLLPLQLSVNFFSKLTFLYFSFGRGFSQSASHASQFFCSVQNKEEDYSSVLATILALGEKFKEKKKITIKYNNIKYHLTG